MKKYLTKIEITSEARNKDEAMEIVGDYLSANIVSGIEMKCITKPVHFYDHAAAKTIALIVLVTIGFLSGITMKGQQNFAANNCQTAAVQVPLKTCDYNKNDAFFKKEWEEKQNTEVLNFIKK